jgi:two-component system, LytTR family, sensor kinase
MPVTEAPALLHIVGYVTGASLYAMLLAMVVRTRGTGYRLTISTAILGLAWNVGELSAHALDGLGLTVARDWMAAISYAALGFLAAVAVASATRGERDAITSARLWRPTVLASMGYGVAAVAGGMQLVAAARGWRLPWSAALVLLTTGLVILSPALLLTTRHQPQGRRALWVTALALFAVSALHLGGFHGTSESVAAELLGHHASIPLAFAILYQDYRFAFADLFLKRALTLLALVTVVFVAWSLLSGSALVPTPLESPAAGILLALWIGTALLVPWLRQQAAAFVDRVLLKRANYSALVDNLAATIQSCGSEEGVLRHVCEMLAPALSAESVTWRATDAPAATGTHDVLVSTAEDPQNVLQIGELRGGRRLLSGDLMMLERVSLLAGRRIDALRLSDERYERMLREREISALAAQAELRALRAQINPHFLFNALTTLGYLIQQAPTRAVDTLMRLTTLLRSVLRSEGEFTTLGHERELIECYLQIERERFEERLDAHVDVPASLAGIAIPSLIVQPLVENAIKHGIARAREGGRVVVTARRDDTDNQLRIVVRNTGAPLNGRTPSAGGGIGLQSVERRLQCYYGDAATLTLTRSDAGETVAELRLPAGHLPDEDEPVLTEQVRR